VSAGLFPPFVAERLMDMGAKALGIDPLEIRRRNLVRADEFPYRIASEIIWDRTGFVECLEAAVQAGEYEELRKQQSAARAEGRYFGIGLATYAELTGIGSRLPLRRECRINTARKPPRSAIDSTGAITAAFGCRLAWAGAGNDARPNHRGRSRARFGIFGWSRATATPSRCRPEPTPAAAPCWWGCRKTRLADTAGENQEGRVRICSSRRRRY